MDTSNTTFTTAICPATGAVRVMVKNEVDYSSDFVDPAGSSDGEPKNYFADSAGCSDVVPNISYDKAKIRVLVDAAVLASNHSKECGMRARTAFDAYTAALVHADNVEMYGINARDAFDAYTVAHEASLEKAAASDAAILEMQEIIERRIAFLSAEQ